MMTSTRNILTLIFFISFLFANSSINNAEAQTDEPSASIRIDNYLFSLQWSPDGQILVAGGVTDIHVFDLNLRLIKSLRGHTSNVRDVAWKPDSNQFVSASGYGDGSLKVWHRNVDNTFDLLQTLTTGNEAQLVVKWSPNGEYLLSVGINYIDDFEVATFYIWNTTTWELERTLAGAYLYDEIEITSEMVSWNTSSTQIALLGQQIVLANGYVQHNDGPHIYIIGVDTGEVISKIEMLGPQYSVAWYTNDLSIAVTNASGLDSYDVVTGQLLNTEIDLFDGVLVKLPIADLAIRTGTNPTSGADQLRIIDLATRTVLKELNNGTWISPSWNGTRNNVATINGNLIEIWDIGEINIPPDLATLTPIPTSEYSG